MDWYTRHQGSPKPKLARVCFLAYSLFYFCLVWFSLVLFLFYCILILLGRRKFCAKVRGSRGWNRVLGGQLKCYPGWPKVKAMLACPAPSALPEHTANCHACRGLKGKVADKAGRGAAVRISVSYPCWLPGYRSCQTMRNIRCF